MSSALLGTGDAIVIKTDNGLGPGRVGEPLNPHAPPAMITHFYLY